MTRKREHVAQRRAQAVAMKEQGYSLREIAIEIGYRSHSTVCSLISGHETEMQNSAAYRKEWSETCRKLVGKV